MDGIETFLNKRVKYVANVVSNMQVDVIESTNDAEKVVCLAARGDYMDGWNADKSFEEVMSVVDYDDSHYERAMENNYYPDEKPQTEARMIAFIERQLSRGHWGICEHSCITFTVKGVSRVTMAQITRHRHMTFDVQSQRYVDFSEKEVITPKSLKEEEHVSRETGLAEVENREGHERAYNRHAAEAFTRYEMMVEDGVPKEDARFILPVGTPVNMTFSGNARTFMHVFNLRQKADAQWEIRELCDKMAVYLKGWAPYMFNWYDENRPHKIGP